MVDDMLVAAPGAPGAPSWRASLVSQSRLEHRHTKVRKVCVLKRIDTQPSNSDTPVHRILDAPMVMSILRCLPGVNWLLLETFGHGQ